MRHSLVQGGRSQNATVFGNTHHGACLVPYLIILEWDQPFLVVDIKIINFDWICFSQRTGDSGSLAPPAHLRHNSLLRTLACLADAFDEHMGLVRYADQEDFDICHLNSFLAKYLGCYGYGMCSDLGIRCQTLHPSSMMKPLQK